MQEEQRVVLDKQVQEKQKAKVQQQQDKVQDAQDLAAALRQHKLDEAKSTAARRAAALKSKALMANQVCFLLQLLHRLWNVSSGCSYRSGCGM